MSGFQFPLENSVASSTTLYDYRRFKLPGTGSPVQYVGLMFIDVHGSFRSISLQTKAQMHQKLVKSLIQYREKLYSWHSIPPGKQKALQVLDVDSFHVLVNYFKTTAPDAPRMRQAKIKNLIQ